MNRLKKKNGFTLVEIIIVFAISAGVFSLVAGVFVQALKIQRRAFFIQKVQENIGFALESMAKEIRVSRIAGLNTDCPAFPSQILNIIHPVNGGVSYFLSETNELHRRLPASGIDTILNSAGTKVSRLGFCLSGNSINDDAQPRVTILLTVSNGHSDPNQNISIDLQTTVSQRFLSD